MDSTTISSETSKMKCQIVTAIASVGLKITPQYLLIGHCWVHKLSSKGIGASQVVYEHAVDKAGDHGTAS